MKTQETRGKVKKLKGRVKEAAGIVTGNNELEDEGSLGSGRRGGGESLLPPMDRPTRPSHIAGGLVLRSPGYECFNRTAVAKKTNEKETRCIYNQ